MLKNLFTPEKIPLDLFGAKKTAQAKTNVSAQQPAQKEKGPQQQQQQPQTQEKTQLLPQIQKTKDLIENREIEAMRLELMRLQTENANLRKEIERLRQSQSDIKRFQVLETS